MNDHFLDNLVGDLKPRKAMQNSLALLMSALALCGLSMFVIALFGMREDFQLAMQSGTLMWKNGGLLLGAIGALYATISLSRPDTKPGALILVLAIIIAAIIIWRIWELSTNSSLMNEMTHINFGGSQNCLSVIFFGGLAIFCALWQFWLRQTASQNPIELGAAAGVLSGLIAGFAYSFHCNMDNIFYYIVCYWLPVMALGTFGGFLGQKLKW